MREILCLNIEGFRRNRYYLSKLLLKGNPAIIFIQEHWLSEYEALNVFSSGFPLLEFHTTSADSFQAPEDVLLNYSAIWHGTAIGFDPTIFLKSLKLPRTSTRFCGVKLSTGSINILAYAVYLPTAGQDDYFLEVLTQLSQDISLHMSEDCIIMIGIDSNVSENSPRRRKDAFLEFSSTFSLSSILIDQRPTFHHNNGTSETQIDHILTNNCDLVKFKELNCKLFDSDNLSSHDAITGEIKIPFKLNKKSNNVCQDNCYQNFKPEKISWKECSEYERMTSLVLGELLEKYDKPEHLPALGEMISNSIALCATKCYPYKKAGQNNNKKKSTLKFSKTLRDAYHNHRKVCSLWRKAGRPPYTTHPAKLQKVLSQRLIQKIRREEDLLQTQIKHNDIITTFNTNPVEVSSKLKKLVGETKSSSSIPKIETFFGLYSGDDVLEGFRKNTEYLCNEKPDKQFDEDFLFRCMQDNFLIEDISKYEGVKIPPITLIALKNIVHKRLKRNKACDIYKLTPEHLKFAGDETLLIVCQFINRILADIDFLAAPEFKLSLATIIHKGKNKPKENHKSYRLVRVCPLICRLIDEYIRPFALVLSKDLQSSNQYGFTEQISYLLGALQRHEAQKFCIDTKLTFFGCSLDGDSAFEVVCRPIQRRELYFAGESGQLAQYNCASYSNTQTCIKLDNMISKPLNESLGVGQGKIRSSDHYKNYINPVLLTLDGAELGVNIGPINVGISGVADDLYLISDRQDKLQGLLDIAQHYGRNYRTEYGPQKTVISVVGSKIDMQYYQDVQPWRMEGKTVSVKENNDHLGLVVSGLREEEKNIDAKIKKARGSLFNFLKPVLYSKCLLSPSLLLHVFRTYICPIARSGLSVMTLRENHLAPLAIFQRKILRSFLRLSEKAPIPALHFLTGEIPIIAKIHRDVFGLFFNVWINPQTKVHDIVKYLLESAPTNSNTWSIHLKNLAVMYEIEDPFALITKKPPSKEAFKTHISAKITSYWEKALRRAASSNSKMEFLNVSLKGLNGQVHPALTGVYSTKDVPKLRAHIKLLCSDIVTYERRAKYCGGSPHCRLCNLDQCSENRPKEDTCHILIECPTFQETRERIINEMRLICKESSYDLSSVFGCNTLLTQFILDCTSLYLPTRISPEDPLCRCIFNLSRDLCYSICSQRSRMLKLLV